MERHMVTRSRRRRQFAQEFRRTRNIAMAVCAKVNLLHSPASALVTTQCPSPVAQPPKDAQITLRVDSV